LTQEHTAALRALLTELESQAPRAGEDCDDLKPGDVAQIRPYACKAFGGMLVVITRAEPYELRGSLLRPHRGGCREAWLSLKHCELERVGRPHWPDRNSDFATRCEDQAGPHCQRAR